ncbi:MAG TPA: HAD family phosphatase [Candidatus Saccharimonadales bacterium]|nr:HAD family phosphatase [Candidatus Saccharimonadales bacterium]
MSETERPFAVFDIDGTLIRWQLYHAIVDALVKSGHITPDKFAQAREARMAWKRRMNETSFYDYEHVLISLHDQVIKHITYNDYLAAVQIVFSQYKGQTYTYTRNLIRRLKKDGYILFAISGSQMEIIRPLAMYYGFDDFGGTQYEIKNGRFTGNKHVLKRNLKPKRLRELVEKHHVTFANSIGVGDSESDIPMLSLVKRPIVFNPNDLLYKHAQKSGWEIVVERKNMIYKLEPSHGQYILA